MMDNNKTKSFSSGGASGAPAGLSSGRRRLLRGSLGAAPVLMTFVSQPVSATYVCKSASAYTSANASRPAVAQCNGQSPDWWKTNSWSGTGCTSSGQSATRFDTYFSATTSYPAGTTLMQVLNGSSSTSAQKLARNCVAALLNAQSGKIGAGVFDAADLKDIWLGGIGSGYVPSPGVPAWNASGINAWMATVFPAVT